MPDATHADRETSVTTCGCAGSARRVCDVCRSAHQAFVACSLRCLRAHQVSAHGAEIAPEAETRVRQSVREMNRNAPDSWEVYAGHRQRTMDRVTSVQGARTSICVFGAGNCGDVDLERLSGTFQRVHLVDLDGEALERARDRQSSSVRERIINHPDVDLSGLLERLDTWGETFPSDAELGPAAVAAARRIVAGLGQQFDVTLSSCVVIPFQFAWVMPEIAWSKLEAVTTAVHLTTLAGSTAPGGKGFLAFDVASSDAAPGFLQLTDSGPEALQAFVEREVEAGSLELHPDPANLLAQVAASPSLMNAPQVSLPWLWNIRTAHQLVYCLSFQRP
jgi:hypothetical protein